MDSTPLQIDFEKYISLRRSFHQIPELGFKEFETSTLILSTLKEFTGFDNYATITHIGQTGLIVDISGKGPPSEHYQSMSIAFRADIDGLPIQELNDIPYKSKHPGIIHGCGHDGHITILIAVIDYYLSHIDVIPSNFTMRFLFEPAEEIGAGAIEMMKGGCLKGITEIYALHDSPNYQIGEFATCPGVFLARSDVFNIHITGKGGHSSQPFMCKNPINTGVAIITEMNQISSQELSPSEVSLLGIGAFQAGTANNVIPETALIKGTIRSFQDSTGEKVMGRIKEISENIATMKECQVQIDHFFGIATVNSEKETGYVLEIIQKYFKLNAKDLPGSASDDMAYYLRQCPGCYFFLGCSDEESKQAELHSPRYDYNDRATPFGVDIFLRIIEHRAQVSLLNF